MNSQQRFALNYFCLFSVFGVVTPYLQALLDSRGFSKSEIGFIQATFETVGLVSPILWGWMSDHSRHRDRILKGVIAMSAVSFVFFGATRSFPVAMMIAVAFGCFYRPVIPLTDGFVMRYISEHGGDYGRPRTAGSIAFIIIVASLEFLGVADEHAGPILILAAMAIFSLVHVLSVSELPLTDRELAERANGKRERRAFDWSILRSRRFVIFCIVAFLGRFGMAGYYGFFTLFAREELGFERAGLLWIFGPLSEIPVIFFSGAIIRRIGARNLFGLGVLGAALRLTGYALVPSVILVLPLQLLHSLTFGAYHTASIHYVNRIVPADMKQSAMAIFAVISLGVASVAGHALGGVIIDAWGYRVMYGIYGATAAIATVMVFLFVDEPEEDQAP